MARFRFVRNRSFWVHAVLAVLLSVVVFVEKGRAMMTDNLMTMVMAGRTTTMIEKDPSRPIQSMLLFAATFVSFPEAPIVPVYH